MHKGPFQINELWLIIRPYLQAMTAALMVLGVLGGWAGRNWLTVLIILAVVSTANVWIGRRARMQGAELEHGYASAVVNLSGAAAIVFLTGGARSPFWLLFLIGTALLITIVVEVVVVVGDIGRQNTIFKFYLQS